ncbi:MAG: TM2 domain-containing protein [Verrucomicrobiota bacterium]
MSEENIPAPAVSKPAGAEKKIAAGICGILLGGLGVHKFILGYTKEGIIMLVCCILGFLILVGPMIIGLIGLIEGIIYLTKSDEDFVATYVNGKKGWF